MDDLIGINRLRLSGDSMVLAFYGAVTAVVIAHSSPAAAQQMASVFEVMSGQWTGEGTIRTTDGGSERIRCRATYRPHNGGISLRQEMLCASDSYKFQVTSDLVQRAETISGQCSRQREMSLAASLGGLAAI